jgi:DNA-binding NarL/FixJ family response regulator/tRNA A-37 threonylcarbamoyl transferase component Bud32
MIGRKLGNRYEVLELIGEGATAAVYRGVDTRLERTVAIKVMLPYVDSTTRRRFQREALAAAKLNHPNIMAIYDVGEEDDLPYLIIEYIEGRPLFSFIPAPPEVTAEFGRQICMALDYAHRQGLIHRDIKPANVHITPNGQAKLMDFGLAISGSTKRLTATGRIIGTPAYLSPEQAQGLPLTPRTDIYSTGVVLYEMVTGVLPFDSDDIGVLLLQQVKKPPQSPSEIVPNIPLSLEHVILKALAKQPEARFETAGVMAAALASAVPKGGQTIITDSAVIEDSVVAEEAETAAAVPEPQAAPDVIRVALADDHRILRASLAMYLNDSEAIKVVGEADDGAQALDMVRQQRPDVLLLDLNMPGTSGLDVLPQIRADLPDIKVLVLTGRDEDAYIIRALRAGAHGYILKTTDEKDLLQAVLDVHRGHLVLGHGVAERVVQGLMARDEGVSQELTDLDRTILIGIAAGLTNDQIAERLRIDAQLVAAQLVTLIEQLNAKSRTEAALIALRRGLISLEDLHSF